MITFLDDNNFRALAVRFIFTDCKYSIRDSILPDCSVDMVYTRKKNAIVPTPNWLSYWKRNKCVSFQKTTVFL